MNCVQDIKEICAEEKAKEELKSTILATSATIAKSLSGAKIASSDDLAELGLAGDVQKCLADNYKKVRVPACKDEVMRNMRIVLKSFSMNPSVSGPCKADREKHCGTVPMGGGRMQECIRDHFDLLSDACQTAEFKVLGKLEVLAGVEKASQESTKNLRFGESSASSISLNGPLAMAGVVTLLRRLRLRSKGYTVVTMDKGG